MRYYCYVLIICISCISIRPPMITFTQTQTALENQMIGDPKEIEDEDWLIASQKSSSLVNNWEKNYKLEPINKQNEKIYSSLQVLAYLSRNLKENLKSEFFAEGLDGKVHLNPHNQNEISKDKKNLMDTININREIIFEYKKNEIENSQINILKKKKLINEIILTYYNLIEPGEYFEGSDGSWNKKE